MYEHALPFSHYRSIMLQMSRSEQDHRKNFIKIVTFLAIPFIVSACGCIPASGDPNCASTMYAIQQSQGQSEPVSDQKPNQITKNLNSPAQPIVPEPTPTPEILNLNPHFCARTDFPELMKNVKDLIGPGGIVRTWKPYEEFGDPNSDLEKLIQAAENYNLIPLVVFSPKNPIPDDIIRQKINSLLTNHPKVSIELLNEIDNPTLDFWQNRDVHTAAHFVQIAIETIDQHNSQNPKNPKTTIVLGGQRETANLANYLAALKQTGINLNRIKYSVHAYIIDNTLGDIANIISNKAIPALKNAGVIDPQIWVTEYGAEYNRGTQPLLVQGSQTALNLGAKVICYHAIEPESQTDIYPTWEGLRHETINTLGSFIASQPK
jgi:hypothetical protein